MDYTIRPETSTDQQAIYEITARAFGRPLEAHLIDLLRASPDFIPALSLVADQDGQVVGHVLFSKARLEGSATSGGLLALGPIAVSPDHQRKGIGGKMIHQGLAIAARLGYQGVILLGSPHYYPRFGFLPGSRYGLKTTYDVPDDEFMVQPLYPGGLEGLVGTAHFSPAFAQMGL